MQLFRNLFKFLKQSLWSDNRIVIFLIFLMLSFGFWLLNALRRTYVSTITCPVQFINLPDHKTIAGGTLRAIDLKVRGSGFSLMRYHLTEPIGPFTVDVSKLRRVDDGFNNAALLVSRDYANRINTLLTSDIELMAMSPDTLYFKLYNKKSKKVPIRFNGTLSFVAQCNQTAPVLFSPDSINVAGSDNIIDTLSGVFTDKYHFDKVGDSITQTVSLMDVPDLELSHHQVQMVIPVETVTESAIEVPVQIRGVKPNQIIKTFPAEVKVSFRVGISQFDGVKSDHFSAVVDVADIDLSLQTRLKVKLEKVPDFVYSIDYSPLFVDFLIEKNN